MTEEALLVGLGLQTAEAKIYLALLKAEPSSIRQTAAAADINRGTAYEAIKNLVSLGLVSYKVAGKRARYSAENPARIQQILDEKQSEVTKLKSATDRILPELLAFSKPQSEAPRVKFYEDDEGIATILRDVLATASDLDKKEYYVYSSRALRQYLYRRFPNFTVRRVNAGIFARVIAIGTGGDPAELSERKFVEDDSAEASSSYNIIYGDKVALISVSQDFTPYGVVIEEPGVAAMQRLLFSRLWDSL